MQGLRAAGYTTPSHRDCLLLGNFRNVFRSILRIQFRWATNIPEGYQAELSVYIGYSLESSC
jgi:hypothetical protein